MNLLMKIASGRIVNSGALSGTNTGKRSATAASSSTTTTTTTTTTTETLGSAAKLGQVGRDKERKEKEDVELKPPWELTPYSRDPSAGMDQLFLNSDDRRISRLLSFQRHRRRIFTHRKGNNRWF
jgi:hypothetical protein